MPWAGNIAKTMTSNGKQFTVTREMLTAVARDQRWPDVAAGISARFSKFAFVFVLLYSKSLNDWSLGEQWILFPSSLNVPSNSSRETLRFVGNKIHCSPRDQSLSVNCYSFKIFPRFWLVKTTSIIHHNQLLFTKFGKTLRHIESMTSKGEPSEIIEPLTSKWRQKCSLLQII